MSKVRHHSPLALPRIHGPSIYRIHVGKDKIKEIDASIFHTRQHVDNAIRILDKEYAYIDTTLPLFTHFNMEYAGYHIGMRIILPRIIRQGHFRHAGDEVLPVLSLKNIYVGVVVSKREHLSYENLHDEIFEYSMKHIKNIDQLKRAILRRYSVSMPDLTDAEILARGVASTTIQLEGIFHPHKL